MSLLSDNKCIVTMGTPGALGALWMSPIFLNSRPSAKDSGLGVRGIQGSRGSRFCGVLELGYSRQPKQLLTKFLCLLMANPKFQ